MTQIQKSIKYINEKGELIEVLKDEKSKKHDDAIDYL